MRVLVVDDHALFTDAILPVLEAMEEFAEDYLKAVRITHEAVRKYSENARVYISLEHHWNIRYPGGDAKQAFPAHFTAGTVLGLTGDS